MSFGESNEPMFDGDLPDEGMEQDDSGNPNFEVNAPIADIAWNKIRAAQDKEGSDPFGY
jgi:hypothetical protein